MAIRKKVSIKFAVDMLLDNIGAGNNHMIPVFQTWAKEAEQKIGSFTQYKRKIYVGTVENCMVKLCCEVQAVNAVLLGDHGCECSLIFNNLYNLFSKGDVLINPLDGFIVVDPGHGHCNKSNVSWTIQNNAIMLSGNYEGSKITYEAYVYETDSNGWMMINENHIDAIAQYIELKWMNRAKHRKGSTTVQYTQGEISYADSEWHRKCALARGEDGAPSASERAEIVAMINSNYTGMPFAQWIWNDPYYSL